MTATETKSVKFDPGYAKHTTILSLSLDYIYRKINSIKNFNQKKFQFKMNYPQIVKMVDNNVGFCIGCILWAVYIKSLGELNIEGNPCLDDEFNETECVEEIDFSIDYLTKLQKDAKYYINQNYEINPKYAEYLNLYREFLLLNKNFVNTKTTSDIILPASVKIPSEENLKTIHNKIEEVIKSGVLTDLFEVLPLVYEEQNA